MPFPNLPYFKDGACCVSETSAVHRYIALKYKPETLGKTVEEQAVVDMLYSKLNDLQNGIIGSCFSGEKDKITECLDNQLPLLIKCMGSKKFLAADYITIVDFRMFEYLIYADKIYEGSYQKKHPELQKYMDAMKAAPGLCDYLKSDGYTQQSFLPPYAKIQPWK